MEDEKAKAVKETAKATQKFIDASEKLGSFLKMVCGDAIIELGGTITDWAKFFRYKNLLHIKDKVEDIHKKRKTEGKAIPIPPRYAIPLVEKASMEDNETIQDMWAGLIANATDPDMRLNLNKIFINIISSLEPLDAKILMYLPSHQELSNTENSEFKGFNIKKIVEEMGVSSDEVIISIQNLYRMGCVVDWKTVTWTELNITTVAGRINDTDVYFSISPLGDSLLAVSKIQM